MKTTQEYIRLLSDFKHNHSAEYGIERLGIFGSVARGEQKTDSDVDVCIEMKQPDMFFLIGIKDNLQKIFDRNVDVVRLRNNMNPLLRKRINKEALYV